MAPSERIAFLSSTSASLDRLRRYLRDSCVDAFYRAITTALRHYFFANFFVCALRYSGTSTFSTLNVIDRPCGALDTAEQRLQTLAD